MAHHEYHAEYPPRGQAVTMAMASYVPCAHSDQVIIGWNKMKCTGCGSQAIRPVTWLGGPWDPMRRRTPDGKVREPVINVFGTEKHHQKVRDFLRGSTSWETF